jgi:hypothetical protein
MACACVNDRKPQCAWCKEAVKNGFPTSQHSCQWGSCS